MSEKKVVEFMSTRSQYDNWSCDCCKDVTHVTMIDIPKAKFFDGENVTVKYDQLWICDDCADKLIAALKAER